MNLDTEEITKWRSLVYGERACLWAQGEFIAEVRREGGREALVVLAQEAGCTLASLNQKADVFQGFPPSIRRESKPWSWHRAIRQTALRTGRAIISLLEEAEYHGWGQRELRALGRKQNYVSWSGKCGTCNARFSVSMAEAMCKGEIFCPVCPGLFQPPWHAVGRLA